MDDLSTWRVAGTYFEACNCEAVCPCRRIGGRAGGRSTYETCDFALSWRILEGSAGRLDLSGLSVVMAGSYADDEPGSPWRVVLYVDEGADAAQNAALETIFLGRAGGTAFENFAANIEEVYAVRPARIALEHERGRQRIRAGEFVTVAAAGPFGSSETISCGIPGHDHTGEELVTELQRVEDGPLRWEVTGRCGFASDFDYRSSGGTPDR